MDGLGGRGSQDGGSTCVLRDGMQSDGGCNSARHGLKTRRIEQAASLGGRLAALCAEPPEGGVQMRTLALDQVIEMVPEGASLMVGGFMGVGTPDRVLGELVRQRKGNLTIIANDTATPGKGIGALIRAKLVCKVIASHIGLNRETQEQMMSGQVDVELVPQGTLIERIRAGGYGLGGVLTPTGVGTVVEEGKQKIELEGRWYLVEKALRADFALVHAFLADYIGNLSYALTARNFNPIIAMAGGVVIANADHIVPVGVISPDHVVTPAPVVDYLVAN